MQERELRKYKDILVTTGTAVTAYGVWTVLKAILLMLMNSPGLEEYLEITDASASMKVLVIVLTLLIYLLVLMFQVWVGTSAIAEGKGKKKSSRYIYGGAVLAVFSFVSQIMVLLYTPAADLDDVIGPFFVELTFFVLTLEMMFAACRVKKLSRKRYAEGEG